MVFQSVQVFLFEIYSWLCYFYMIKKKNWTPITQRVKRVTRKKQPMDYDNDGIVGIT